MRPNRTTASAIAILVHSGSSGDRQTPLGIGTDIDISGETFPEKGIADSIAVASDRRVSVERHARPERGDADGGSRALMRRQRVKRAVVVRVMQVGVMRKRGPVRLVLSLCPVLRAMRPLMREGCAGL